MLFFLELSFQRVDFFEKSSFTSSRRTFHEFTSDFISDSSASFLESSNKVLDDFDTNGLDFTSEHAARAVLFSDAVEFLVGF